MIPFATAFLAARSAQRVDPPVNVVLPAVSGAAVVNSTLIASTGTWLGDPINHLFQWLRGAVEIPGAQGPSYTTTAADIGHAISVRVTATNAGGSTPATSSATAAIQNGIPTNLVPPAVSGLAEVGSTLTSTTGSWSGSPTGFSRVWLRGTTAISGANAASYTLTAADAGYPISLRTWASNANGISEPVTSAATAAVTYPRPVNIDLPTISGTAAVGNTLSLWRGTWSNSPVGYTQQWRRGTSNIPNATGTSYTVTSADIGYVISCRVVATNAGGDSSPATATAGAVGNPVPVNTAAPRVHGTVAVGSLLSGNAGDWTETPTGYDIQWQRGTGNISGATGWSYTPTSADIGHTLRIRVIAKNAHGSSSPAYSSSTATVPPPPDPPVNTALPSIGGNSAVGGTLVANRGSWTNNPTSYRYEWYSTKQARVVGTSSSYNVVAADAGGPIHLAVWASNVSGERGPANAAPVTAGPPAPVNTALPTISGTLKVGSTLTAGNGSWSNSPTEYEYRWAKGGSEADIIATTKTYALQSGDLYATMQVRVRARNAGGWSAWATSAYTTSVQPGP